MKQLQTLDDSPLVNVTKNEEKTKNLTEIIIYSNLNEKSCIFLKSSDCSLSEFLHYHLAFRFLQFFPVFFRLLLKRSQL